MTTTTPAQYAAALRRFADAARFRGDRADADVYEAGARAIELTTPSERFDDVMSDLQAAALARRLLNRAQVADFTTGELMVQAAHQLDPPGRAGGEIPLQRAFKASAKPADPPSIVTTPHDVLRATLKLFADQRDVDTVNIRKPGELFSQVASPPLTWGILRWLAGRNATRYQARLLDTLEPSAAAEQFSTPAELDAHLQTVHAAALAKDEALGLTMLASPAEQHEAIHVELAREAAEAAGYAADAALENADRDQITEVLLAAWSLGALTIPVDGKDPAEVRKFASLQRDPDGTWGDIMVAAGKVDDPVRARELIVDNLLDDVLDDLRGDAAAYAELERAGLNRGRP